MKKILFAALAALAITSCSQNEEIEAPTQKTEINFRSVVGKSSRAAEATTENLESQGFILYAYNTKTITMDKGKHSINSPFHSKNVILLL